MLPTRVRCIVCTAPDREEYEYGGDATSDEDSDPDYRPAASRRKHRDNEEYDFDSEPPSSDYGMHSAHQ